jgi:hypothetical protein
MNKNMSLMICIALLAATGCGTRPVEVAAPSALELLHGSSATITMQYGVDSAAILVTRVEPTGTFLRLHLAPGQELASESWSNDHGTLHLVAPVPDGLDIGIVGLPDYTGGPVSLRLKLARGGSKVASRPPTGAHNIIPDLTVNAIGAGEVSLAWTQRNVGDYDFNGEVNIADLTPLGQHFQNTVNRSAVGADQLTEFWVDGDENGEINLGDLTVIGQNYTASVAGYNIRQNGTLLLNGQGQSPTVAASGAIPRPGLPSTYLLTLNGAVADAWVATAVDGEGNEGADSGGGLGPVDLSLNLNISGPDLLDLVGSGSGPFGPGKFGSRVIDPGYIVDNAPIGATTLSGTTAKVSGLPRGKVLLARVQFAPVVNLATGAPKGGARLKSGSSVSAEESEFISVPFELPLGTDPVNMSLDIAIEPNPAGGYFVTLTATLDVYGDDPATPAVETKYVKTYTNRLAYATGKVSRDTDGDGIFEDDEADYGDDDRDCLSEMEVKNEEDWDEHEDDDNLKYKADSATLTSIDFDTGFATFSNIVSDPEFPPLDPTLTVRLREDTKYLRSLSGSGPEPDLEDVDLLTPGSNVEFEAYAILDAGTGAVIDFWCDEIALDVD